MIVMTDGGILKLKETYKKGAREINNNSNASTLKGKTGYVKGLKNDSLTKIRKKNLFKLEDAPMWFYKI